MSFQSSIRFNNNNYRIRRVNTEPDRGEEREEEREEEWESQRGSSHRTPEARPSKVSPGGRLKLVPVKEELFKSRWEEAGRIKRRDGRSEQPMGEEVQLMKSDISRIRHEIMSRRYKSNQRVKSQAQERRIIFQEGDPEMGSSKKELFKPVWRKPYTSFRPQEGVVREASRESQEEDGRSEEESSMYFPIIEKRPYRIEQPYRMEQPYKVEQPYRIDPPPRMEQLPKYEQPQRMELREVQPVRGRVQQRANNNETAINKLREYFMRTRETRRSRPDGVAMRNFRKIGHVVLFTIYLRKFNERMRTQRKLVFTRYLKSNLKDRLLQMKQLLIESLRPFLLAVVEQCNFEVHPSQRDDIKLRKEKFKAIWKLVRLFMECLRVGVNKVCGREVFGELLYLMCGHGSYGCQGSVNTGEELEIMCFSEVYGYHRADKFLVRSALISLVLVKMVLFNVLFDVEVLALAGLERGGRQAVGNLVLIGTIFYEVFVDLQDDMLEQAPVVYTVGNWHRLMKENRLGFRAAPNMTVKAGVYQKNELISGLEDHKSVREMFGTKSMTEEKQGILVLVNQLFELLRREHERVRGRCWLKAPKR